MSFKNLVIILTSFGINSYGQNLVPNPGFDTYISCVTAISEWDLTPPWKVPYDQTGTPDYANACYPTSDNDQSVPENYYGYEEAISGKGYYGMITYYEHSEVREYLGAPLISKLEKGKTYFVGCFVSKADNYPYAIDEFGLYFSDERLAGEGDASAMTEYEPQVSNPEGNMLDDSQGWTLISGRYTAKGNETFITVGNFASDADTDFLYDESVTYDDYGYYYLDNIFVVAIEDSAAYMDDVKNKINVTVIDLPSVPDLTAAGSEGHGSKFIDMPEQILKIYLVIDGDFKTLEVKDDNNLTYLGIKIYNEAGNIVAEEPAESGTSKHKFIIEHLKNGDYFIEIRTKERRFKKTRFIIDR